MTLVDIEGRLISVLQKILMITKLNTLKCQIKFRRKV